MKLFIIALAAVALNRHRNTLVASFGGGVVLGLFVYVTMAALLS